LSTRNALIAELSSLDCVKGDLAYVVYLAMATYMRHRKHCYAELHDTVYAVNHSAHEFERQHLDIREDEAIKENGEAYYTDNIWQDTPKDST